MKKQITRYFPLLAASIFLLTAALMFRMSGFDFGRMLSETVAFSGGRSVLYFVVTAVMTVLMGISLHKTEMNNIRKFIYALILLCILVMGCCPLTYSGNVTTKFSFAGMLHIMVEFIFLGLTAVSSLQSVIFAKSKVHRIVGLLPVLYVAVILIEPSMFKANPGIWEIIFIMQPILLLQSEQHGAEKRRTAAAA